MSLLKCSATYIFKKDNRCHIQKLKDIRVFVQSRGPFREKDLFEGSANKVKVREREIMYHDPDRVLRLFKYTSSVFRNTSNVDGELNLFRLVPSPYTLDVCEVVPGTPT